MNEKERLMQEQLDIKCLQLLRGILHNEIVKLPEDWESHPKEHLKWVILHVLLQIGHPVSFYVA